MKLIGHILSIILLVIIQLGLYGFGWSFSVPNLALIYFCILLGALPVNQVILLSVFAGLLLDILSGLPDGVIALSLPLSLAVANYFGLALFDRLRDYVLLVRLFVASVVYSLGSLLVFGVISLIFLNHVPDLIALIWPSSFIRLFFEIVFIVPVYLIYLMQYSIVSKFGINYESV